MSGRLALAATRRGAAAGVSRERKRCDRTLERVQLQERVTVMDWLRRMAGPLPTHLLGNAGVRQRRSETVPERMERLFRETVRCPAGSGT